MGTFRDTRGFGSEVDPASNAPAAVTTTASSGSAPTNGQQIRYQTRAFDKDTDEGLFFPFYLPSNYASGGALIVPWLTTVTSGAVVWKTGYALVHPSSEGSPTDLTAAVVGTITSASPITVPSTAGQITYTELDLGLSGAHGGDLIVVYFARDADDGSDTADADVLLTEPWVLTGTTT